MAHLHDGHAGAVVVEHLGGRLAQHLLGKHSGTGGKVVDPSMRRFSFVARPKPLRRRRCAPSCVMPRAAVSYPAIVPPYANRALNIRAERFNSLGRFAPARKLYESTFAFLDKTCPE